jgi:2-polyprenyl-6-methoxyphenol hydroxylase-like FAD-dependent oxidoreductase
LALYDAYVLSQAVAAADDVPRALDAYSRARRAHLGYYQLVTRWLTPFFQSDYAALGTLRDVGMPVLAKVGLFRRAMVWGMCGMADGHPWAQVPLPAAVDSRETARL